MGVFLAVIILIGFVCLLISINRDSDFQDSRSPLSRPKFPSEPSLSDENLLISSLSDNKLTSHDRYSLELFADGLAENNLNHWRSLQVSPMSVIQVMAEVVWSNDALPSTQLKVSGWKIQKQYPVKISSISEAIKFYKNIASKSGELQVGQQLNVFLSTLTKNQVAVILILKTPKGCAIFPYGFSV